MTTERLYLTDNQLLSNEATVIEVCSEQERMVVILDKTAFYPQGGGQPYDTGTIESPTTIFNVEDVRYINDLVKHYGQLIKGTLSSHDHICCKINPERRDFNNRLHSAGHVVDMAVHELKLNWTPEKGHHFPENPYVEYSGTLDDSDKGALKQLIENTCNRLIQENHATEIKFVSKEELKNICHFTPNYIPTHGAIRLIAFGKHFCLPCGGTHVATLSEIKHMNIRKIKVGKGKIHIGYEISH